MSFFFFFYRLLPGCSFDRELPLHADDTCVVPEKLEGETLSKRIESTDFKVSYVCDKGFVKVTHCLGYLTAILVPNADGSFSLSPPPSCCSPLSQVRSNRSHLRTGMDLPARDAAPCSSGSSWSRCSTTQLMVTS